MYLDQNNGIQNNFHLLVHVFSLPKLKGDFAKH